MDLLRGPVRIGTLRALIGTQRKKVEATALGIKSFLNNSKKFESLLKAPP